MNKFVFENSTKAYFGEGCVKEHLPRLLEAYEGNVMLAYGGGFLGEADALRISVGGWRGRPDGLTLNMTLHYEAHRRSDERRVGKECRSRWSTYH